MTQESLVGQVALITGASQGIGGEIARTLAAEGIHLALTARTEANLNALADDLRREFPNVDALVIPADVRDADQCQKVVEQATQRFGHIDVLVNNAGVAGKIALLQEISFDEIDRTLDTNLKAPIYLMKLTLPGMIARQRGTIININSVAGKTAFPYWSIYDASKFGLLAITEAVGEEQRSNNIKVVGVYPGAVDTPIWNGIELDHEPKRAGMLSPQSVAEAVLYILRQPPHVHIPEITLKPLHSVL